MSVYMTADIDSYRKPCNVSDMYINCKRSSCSPSPPTDPDSKAVDFLSISSSMLLHMECQNVPHFSCQSFFCHQRTFSKVPPIPTQLPSEDGHSDWRLLTAVRIACFTPSIPSAGFNINTRLIFSLPNPLVLLLSSPYLLQRFGMEHCRCIIFVFSRINGSLPQIFLKTFCTPVWPLHWLPSRKYHPPDAHPPDFQKYNCHSGILTDWNHIISRNF